MLYISVSVAPIWIFQDFPITDDFDFVYADKPILADILFSLNDENIHHNYTYQQYTSKLNKVHHTCTVLVLYETSNEKSIYTFVNNPSWRARL